MFQWTKVRTSGGQELYMRVRIARGEYRHFHTSFGKKRTCYNAMANEWDVFPDFLPEDDEDDSDANADDDSDAEDNQVFSPSHMGNSDSFVDTAPDANTLVDSDTLPLQSVITHCLPSMLALDLSDAKAEGDSDMLEVMSYSYGYTSPLGLSLGNDAGLDWNGVLMSLGIVNDPLQVLSSTDKAAIRLFVSHLAMGSQDLPAELDTLNPHNHSSIEHLFEFRNITRPTEGLFIFDTPRSSVCAWVLGVHSASAALYICRYILSNPLVHTILTVAHRLLQRGISFRTLELLPFVPHVETLLATPTPSSYRQQGYHYSQADFDAAMLKCKQVLSTPQGRAALLQGGIVGRIAREFLSLDSALEGPSVEVTKYRAGVMIDSHMRGYQYWDDSLSDLEIGVICGTYVLYTGEN